MPVFPEEKLDFGESVLEFETLAALIT